MKPWQKITLLAVLGAFTGMCILAGYMMRAHTYLGDDPSACVNCHIMAPYYATWQHSSHGRDGAATCNDCHVPHENFARKWAFKATDGMSHVAKFVTHSEHQAIAANDNSANVIMNNCVRCHEQLNNEFVKTGRINFMMAQRGEGKACWDCHRETPHGRNSLSSTMHAQMPFPESPVPAWLQGCLGSAK